MAVYSGRTGVVYMSTSGSGTATNVIKLTRWSVDQSQDAQEVTAFGDSNRTYVVGFKNLEGEFEGFWDDTENKPFQGADSSDGVKLYLYPASGAATKYWYGPAWIDTSIETPVDGPVAISGSFRANGAWGRQ